MKKINLKLLISLIITLILYLLLPNANSSNDAYAYAAYIKYGYGLLEPFHMLYNVTGFLVHRGLSWVFVPDVLLMMKCLNSIFAVLSLWVLYKILEKTGVKPNLDVMLILICAFSFGVCRYATENETYILPIFFSLSGSWYYLKFLRSFKKLDLLFTGFLTSFACLFHVIHVFWWLGLGIGVIVHRKEFRSALYYLLPALIVPLFYLIIVPIVQHCTLSFSCIWSFFSPVLESDVMQYKVGADNLFLGIINFVRTFYQIHGNMYLLVRNNILYILPACISFAFLTIAFVRFWRKRLFEFKPTTHFVAIHLLIFILQLLFAFYSKGNAEFMVMLPFLLAIIASFYIKPDKQFWVSMFISVFIWNMSYGLLFNHFADFTKREKLISSILNKKDGVFLLEQSKEIQNQIFYKTGVEDMQSVKNLPKNKQQLDSILSWADYSGKKVFTDFYDQKRVIDRYALTKTGDSEFMLKYKHQKVDSFENFYGRNFIFKID